MIYYTKERKGRIEIKAKVKALAKTIRRPKDEMMIKVKVEIRIRTKTKKKRAVKGKEEEKNKKGKISNSFFIYNLFITIKYYINKRIFYIYIF